MCSDTLLRLKYWIWKAGLLCFDCVDFFKACNTKLYNNKTFQDSCFLKQKFQILVFELGQFLGRNTQLMNILQGRAKLQ